MISGYEINNITILNKQLYRLHFEGVFMTSKREISTYIYINIIEKMSDLLPGI